MLIEAKMTKAFDIGWYPEHDLDPAEEEKDIILKAQAKLLPQREVAKNYPIPGIIGMFALDPKASMQIKACRRHRCVLESQHD